MRVTIDEQEYHVNDRAAEIVLAVVRLQAEIARFPVGSLEFHFANRKISAKVVRSELVCNGGT